jgi:hypothetical protein
MKGISLVQRNVKSMITMDGGCDQVGTVRCSVIRTSLMRAITRILSCVTAEAYALLKVTSLLSIEMGRGKIRYTDVRSRIREGAEISSA